jgi:SGNH hydrolase-like domain, acetyltransferase AlgX
MTGPENAAHDASPSGIGEAARTDRPALRTVIACAPWLAFAAAVSGMALWWTQRPWPMRLAGCSALAAWLLGWSWSGLRSALDTRLRAPLLSVAGATIVLGLQGAVFGLATVPVVLSAWLASAGALLFAIAAIGSPLARAKALAATISTVLALAALEAGARGLGIGETARESDSLEIARRFNNLTPPRSAFVNRPRPLDEFPPASIEINAIGIRGPDIPTGKVDLLLLGDSFIEARQLPWEATLGPQLQATLRARSSSARVVSHGMRGWSPLLEWNWYLKVGRRFQPDRVLLFFFWNDLWTAGTEAQTFRAVLGPDGRPDHFDVLLDPGWIWYRHARTVRLIEEVVRLVHARSIRWSIPAAPVGSMSSGAGTLDEESARRIARSMAGGPSLSAAEVKALLAYPPSSLTEDLQGVVRTGFWPGMRPMEIWTRDQIEAAAATEGELARFAQDVASDGGRLVIVYVPNPYQLGTNECTVGRYLDRLGGDVTLPEDSGTQAWLRSVASKHGIEFLDPTAAMRRWNPGGPAAGKPSLYLRSDCHWSPRGHEFMADWLARWYLSGRTPET